MFTSRYFADRYWAPRYWAKVGAEAELRQATRRFRSLQGSTTRIDVQGTATRQEIQGTPRRIEDIKT